MLVHEVTAIKPKQPKRNYNELSQPRLIDLGRPKKDAIDKWLQPVGNMRQTLLKVR